MESQKSVFQLRSPSSLSILVVDDDEASLSVVSAILQSLNYKVVAVRNANEALFILRVSRGSFHLVLTELHLPNINGFELLKIIHQEFHLPVVFMSVVGDENAIIKGLESGASFFLVKPVSPDNLKMLWQIAVVNREMSPSFDKIVEVREPAENQPAEMDFEPAKLTNFGKEMGGAGVTSASGSKPRVVWTNELNNKFLEAIRALGHKASPKDITEFMAVPGLSRRLVASHLQDFLRSKKDPINRDVSILAARGLLGLQYLTPSIRQYQEARARISSAFNLNFSSNLNRVPQNNISPTNQGGGSFSPPRFVNLIKQASLPSLHPSPPIHVPQTGLLLHERDKSDNFSSDFLDNDVEFDDTLRKLVGMKDPTLTCSRNDIDQDGFVKDKFPWLEQASTIHPQQQQNEEQLVNSPLFGGYGSNHGGQEHHHPPPF